MGRLFVPESLMVTLDASNGFHSEAVFDLGGPSVLAAQATLLAADLDGLAWGEAEGDVTLGLAGVPQQSDDGTYWFDTIGSKQEDYTGEGSLPFALTFGGCVTSRFVRVRLGFFAWPGAVQYEGEANPTATIRVDLRMG